MRSHEKMTVHVLSEGTRPFNPLDQWAACGRVSPFARIVLLRLRPHVPGVLGQQLFFFLARVKLGLLSICAVGGRIPSTPRYQRTSTLRLGHFSSQLISVILWSYLMVWVYCFIVLFSGEYTDSLLTM